MKINKYIILIQFIFILSPVSLFAVNEKQEKEAKIELLIEDFYNSFQSNNLKKLEDFFLDNKVNITFFDINIISNYEDSYGVGFIENIQELEQKKN